MISFKFRINCSNVLINSRYFSNYKRVENKLNKGEVERRPSAKRPNVTDGQSSQRHCIECVKYVIGGNGLSLILRPIADRKYDFENYLSTLLLSPSVRRQAFAIRAFNAEISQIRDLTSTQMMAQIRLQYWSDLIDQIFADDSMVMDTNQPVAFELQWCERNAKLSKHWFKKLIRSRTDGKSLGDFPYRTFEELEEYCDSSVTPVYHLIVQCSSTSGSPLAANQLIDLDHMSHHLGRAQGITNVLRGVLHNAAYNRCYIPSELLVKHNTSHEDFLRLKPTDNMLELCFEMASKANQHIQTVSSLVKRVDKQNRLIFLPIVAVKNYLDRLEKCDFNIFHPKLKQRNGFLPFILWIKSKVM